MTSDPPSCSRRVKFRRGQFQSACARSSCALADAISVGPPAFEEVVQFRLRLREVFIRLLQRGGLRLAVQPEEQLPGLDRAAPGHGQIGERASQRRGDIDIFALDVALKGDGGTVGVPRLPFASCSRRTWPRFGSVPASSERSRRIQEPRGGGSTSSPSGLAAGCLVIFKATHFAPIPGELPQGGNPRRIRCLANLLERSGLDTLSSRNYRGVCGVRKFPSRVSTSSCEMTKPPRQEDGILSKVIGRPGSGSVAKGNE